MTIPCWIFRLRLVYWRILVPIVFFYTVLADYIELMFDPDSALISAMWLGIRDWNFFHTWMAGWMFAGAWLILPAVHQAWLL